MDIYNDCYDLIVGQRHEMRAAPMLDLVTMLLDYGYDGALTAMYENVIADSTEEVGRVEGLITNCAVALAGRLGIALNTQSVYNHPKETVRLLQGITERFEEFEDSDALYSIILSGEEPSYILETMCRYVYGDDDIHFEDLIIQVTPRVMTVMRNFLSAAAAERAEEDMAPRQMRIISYLRAFPENPSSFVFLNLPPIPDMTVVQQSLDFDNQSSGISEEDMLVIYTVGLSIVEAEEFDAAYENLEKYLDLINNDGFPKGNVLARAFAAIKLIYGVDVNNAEA